MSRKDHGDWEAWLAADPALRTAWDGFRGTLADIVGLLPDDPKPHMDELRAAADRVMDAAGEGQSRH